MLAKGYSVNPENLTQVKDELYKIKGTTRDIMAQETMDRLTTKNSNYMLMIVTTIVCLFLYFSTCKLYCM